MAFNGGDIIEITGTHPTLPAITLKLKKGSDLSYSLGGIRTEDNEDDISGDGEPIYMMTQNRWFVEGTCLWDMLTRDELSLLAQYSASIAESNWTFNCINGDVRGGKGKPVGDLTGTNKAEIPFKISGGGTLDKIG